MSVPTISTVSPSWGLTRGRYRVVVTGSNFHLPYEPPANEIPAVFRPSVRVTWGGTVLDSVDVISNTQIEFLCPPHVVGKVTLQIDNLDADGEPIAGETVSLDEAFEYRRPVLTSETVGDLARVVSHLISCMRRDLLEQVTLMEETDYSTEDERPLYVAHFSKLPGLCLLGPGVTEDDGEGQDDEDTEQTLETGGFLGREAPLYVRLTFDIVGASDRHAELLNLQQNTAQFFRAGEQLQVPIDPNDPAKGTLDLDMRLTSELRKEDKTNRGNVRTFSGSLEIRRVPLCGWAGGNTETIEGVPVEQIVHQGGTFETLDLGMFRLADSEENE